MKANKLLRWLALSLVPILLSAAPVDDRIAEGRAALAAHDLATARAKFQQARAADATNQTAAALSGLVRIFALVGDAPANGVLNGLGMSATGRDLYNWQATMPKDAAGDVVLPAGYNLESTRAFWRDAVIPAAAAARADLAAVTDDGFVLTLTAAELNSTHTVTMDRADLLVMQAGLRAAEMLFNAGLGQNFNGDYEKLYQIAKGDMLTFQRAMDENPDLLKAGPLENRQAAKAALLDFVNLYRRASSAVRARPAGLDRMFMLDTEQDLSDEANFRSHLADLEKGATDYVELDGGKKHVSLAPMATAGWSLRAALPASVNGRLDPTTITDSTIGGVILGTTREWFARALVEAGYIADLGWTRINPNPVSASLSRYIHTGAAHLITGTNGTIGRSLDGVTWTYQQLPNSQDLFSVASNGSGLVIAEGNTQLWRSTDHGATWKLVHTTWRGTAPDNEGGMFGLVWDGARFVTITNGGYIYTSNADGTVWTRGKRIAPVSTGLSVFNLDYGNGRLIATCVATTNGLQRSAIYVSSDAANWNLAFTGATSAQYRSATYAAGRWLVTGSFGRIAQSTDNAATWSENTVGTTNDVFTGATYFGGTWTLSGTRTATSTDTQNWTFFNNPENASHTRGTLAPDGSVMLLGNQGLLYKFSGGTFTRLDANNTFVSRSGGLNDALVFNNRLYAAGAAGAVYESTDGINFTLRQTSTSNNLFTLAAFGGKLYAAGALGTIVSSTDGTNWQTVISNNSALTVASVNRLFAANGQLLAATSGGTILTSPDGTTWTRRSLPSNSGVVFSLAAGGGYYVGGLGAATVNGVVETAIIYSTDSVNWTRMVVRQSPTPQTTDSNIRHVLFDGGSFLLFVGNGEVIRTNSANPANGWQFSGNKLGYVNGGGRIGDPIAVTSQRINDEARSSFSYTYSPNDEEQWVRTELPSSEFISNTAALFNQRYFLVGSGGGVYRTSKPFNRPAPAVGPAVTLVGTIGHDVTLAAAFTSSEELTYQWSLNGSPILGATGRGLTLANLTGNQAGTYTVTATGRLSGVSVTNTVTLLVVNGAPQITQQPAGGTATTGRSFTFAVAANGSGTLTYQWFKNNVALAGATASTLALSNVGMNDAGNYRVEVSNPSGTTISSDASLVVTSGAVAAFWDDSESVFSPNRLVHDGNGKMYASWNIFAQTQDVSNGLAIGGFYRLDENTGAADPTFVWDERLGSALFSAVQTDGKIVVAVNHSSGEGCTLVRVNSNGTRDTSFNAPRFDRSIRFITLQGDGKVLVAAVDGQSSGNLPAGSITVANPTVYRLGTDGAMDNTFTPVVLTNGGNVFAPPAVDASGNIYIIGNFSAINGTTRRAVARVSSTGVLDGFADPATMPAGWATSVIGRALGFQSDGKIVLAGRFAYTARGNLGTDPILAVRFNPNGSFDSTFAQPLRSQTPTDTTVGFYGRYLVMDANDKFFLTVDRLMHFNADGTLDAAWPTNSIGFGKEGFWISRSPVSGNLYVTDIQNIPGQIAAFTPSGQTLAGFNTGGFGTSNVPRSAIILDDGRLLAAGFFDHFGALRMPGTALFGANGVLAGDATAFHNPGVLFTNPTANAFKWLDGSFGVFRWELGDPVTGAGGQSPETHRYNADGSSRPSWSFGDNSNTIWNFTPLPDGGLIAWVSSPTAANLLNLGTSAWVKRFNRDGSADANFAPNLSSLSQITRDSGGFLVFNTGTIADLQVSGDGSIFFLAAGLDGKVAVRKLQPNGQPDPNYTPLSLGNAAFSSGFTTSLFDPVKNQSYQATSSTYSTVGLRYRILPDGSAYVVGGMTISGNQRSLVRLTAAGALDPNVADVTATLNHPLGLNPQVSGIALDDAGRLYVAGRFDNINGTAVPGLIRFTADGAFDSTWSPGVEVRDHLGLGVTMVAGRGNLHILGPVAAPGDARSVGYKRVAITSVQPFFIGQSASGTVNAGQNVTLYGGAFGGGNMTYSWTRNGVTIAGANAPVLDLGAAGANTPGTYRLTVTNANGSAQTNDIVLAVSNFPLISVGPQSLTVTQGGAAQFTVNAVSATPLSYQWRKGGSDIGGATSASYSIPATQLSDAGSYTVVVTNAAGSVESAAATLTVNALPAAATITQQPQSQTIFSGYTVTLGVSVTPPSGATVTSYQWFQNGSLFQNFTTSLTNSSSISVSAPGTGSSNNYYVVIGTSNGGTITSATATITGGTAPYSVSTFAGTSTRGTFDGTGSAARFANPQGAVGDGAGNLYVADSNNHTIRKVTSAGVVTTFAGAAIQSGTTNGTLTVARFSSPQGLAIDGSGNLYVAGGNMIRKISAGNVTTLAGSSTGLSGSADNAVGSSATFNFPTRLAVDAAGNVYVADSNNHKIRKITPAGAVTTIAGGGATGTSSGNTDGVGTAGLFNFPRGIVALADGTLYVADSSNHTIRRVATDGTVTTVAGLAGTSGTTDNATPTSARFSTPQDLFYDATANALYVVDGAHTIRKIDLANGSAVTTVAGTGFQIGFTDATGTAARFNNPRGIGWMGTGFGITDSSSNTIRFLTPAGVVSTLAGLTPGSADGTGTGARFYQPEGIVRDSSGNLYVCDDANRTIRKITPAGVVTTFSGVASPVSGSIVDGNATTARYGFPRYLAINEAAGVIYVWDSGVVRKLQLSDGSVSFVAGANFSSGAVDSATPSAARFGSQVTGLAVASTGDIYVSDFTNNTIRKVTPAGVVTTVAGVAGSSGTVDGSVAGGAASSTVRVALPQAIAIDSSDNVFFTQNNGAIRKIDPAGNVTTFAGQTVNSQLDGAFPFSRVSSAAALAFGADGNLYACGNSPFLWKISPTGTITTLAGSFTSGYVDASGSSVRFDGSAGLVVAPDGTIFISDKNNGVIRRAVATPAITFTTIPASQSVPVGTNVTLTVSATGVAGINYQWVKNGVDIPGATSNTYTITNAQTTDSGNYAVRAFSGNSVAVSANGVLTVLAAVANDNFASPTALTGLSGAAATVTNSVATGEVGEPVHFNGNTTASSVWYSYRPVASGVATFDTAGSAIDTAMAIYTGSTLANLAFLAQNNDVAGSTAARLSLPVTAGTTYYLAVGSNGTARGNINLTHSLLVTPQPGVAVVTNGAPGSITVAPDAANGVTVQWQKDGVDVAGATGATLAQTGSGVFTPGFIVGANPVSYASSLPAAQISVPLNSVIATDLFNTTGLDAAWNAQLSTSQPDTDSEFIVARGRLGYGTTFASTAVPSYTVFRQADRAAVLPLDRNWTAVVRVGVNSNDIAGTGGAGNLREAGLQLRLTSTVNPVGTLVSSFRLINDTGTTTARLERLATVTNNLGTTSNVGTATTLTAGTAFLRFSYDATTQLITTAVASGTGGFTSVGTTSTSGTWNLTRGGSFILGLRAYSTLLSIPTGALWADDFATAIEPPAAPSVTSQPVGATNAPEGGTTSLNASFSTLSLNPWTAQWFKDGVAIPSTTPNATASGSNQTVINLFFGATAPGNYYATITQNGVTTTTNTVTITQVPSAPLFFASGNISSSFAASAGVLPAGSSVALTVTPQAGTAPMTYQWIFNGTDIPGATGASYFVGNWQAAHQGLYSVRATNALGTATSPAEMFYSTPEGGWRWRNPTPTGNGVTRVVFLNGQFIMGGIRGTLLVSTDGLNWTTRQLPAQNNIFNLVPLGPRYLAMGSLNGMFLSKDTITWETRPTGINGANTSLQDFVSGAGRVVAFGTGGVTAVTTDGLNWTPGTLGNGRTDTLFGATFVLNRYFGVSGNDGSVFSSADGVNWTSVATGATAGLRGLAFGAGRLVAVGNNGAIVVSTNGTNWTPVSSGTTNGLVGVNFVNGRFIAVGAASTILTSPDGLVWTPRNVPLSVDGTFTANSTLQNTAYGNGRYVIAGQGTRVVLTSTDSENWSHVTTGAYKLTDFQGVASSGSTVVAIGNVGSIASSSDLATWTQRASSTSNQLLDVAYAQNKFVAVGASGSVLTSPDGAAWTLQPTSPTISTNFLVGVRYFSGPGLWVAVSGGAGVYTAPDSTPPFTWTKRTVTGTTAQLRKVATGGGMFVAVGQSGAIVSTADATTTWTARTSGTTLQFNDVTYGNGTFLAVGNGGVMSRSTDGITWTTTTLGVNQLLSANYLNGQFIVTSSSNNYYTSTDGINWVGRTTGAADQLNDTVLFGNQLVGVGRFGTILTAGAPVVEGGGTHNVDPGVSLALKFAVSQSPESVTYTWFKDGNPVNGAPNSPVLDLARVSVSDAGAYTLQAQNSYGTVTSANAINVVLNVSLAITAQPQPQTVLVGGNANFSVTATGTPAPSYQWKLNGVNVGTDSPNLTLNNLRLADTGNVTVTLTNAAGTVTSSPAALTVNPLAPSITSPNAAFTVSGAPFRFQVVASTVATFGATGLPAGLTLNATTGVIEGSTTQTGTFNVGLTVTNVTGTGNQTLQITVQPPAPVITSPLSVSGRAGQPFSYTITASNSPTDFGAFALPSGISRNGAVLSGTPSAAGFYSAQILASNATGFASAPLSIQIAAPLNAPTFSGSGNVPGTAGTAFSFTPAFGGSPTSFALVNLPDGSPSLLPIGLTLNTATGAITGTTTQTGSFKIAIRATNADGAFTQVFTLTINPAPSAPAIKSPTSAIGTVGTPFTFNITTDPAATSFSSNSLPDGLSLNADTGVITGVPTTPGITAVTLTATNGSGSGSGPLQITINSSASAPVMSSAAVAPGRVGVEFSFTLAASNTPTSFVVTQGNLPAGLMLDAATGAISGTPSAAGQTKVWVAASNVAGGRGPAVEMLFDIARALNVPVITSNGSAPGQVGATFQYQTVATNAPTSYTATTLPDGLSFNTSTGVISGIPSTETTTPFEVTLTAVNADGASAPKVLAISIAPAPATPKITSALKTGGRVGTSFSYQITATATPTSFTTDQLPDGLTLDSTTGLISGTPTASGTTNVQIRASNAAGLGQASTLEIEIAAPLTAPAITSDPTANAKVGVFFSYQIVATNSPTGYAVTGSLPGGLSLNTNTGVISGNPADSPGLFAINLLATNTAGTSQPQQLLINVEAADNTPVITSASRTTGIVGVAFSYQITATNVPGTTPFPPSVSLDALGLPTGLAVNASTGLIEGTPTAVGTYTVALYGVNSNGTGPSRLLTIKVDPAPNAPSVNSSTTVNAQAGTPFSYQITATNTPTSFEALDAPAWLSVNTTSGLLSGTPTGPGTATVRLGASNAGGSSSYVTLTITIAAAPNTPVITSEQQPPAGRIGQSFSYDLAATLSPTSYSVSGLPPGLTVNAAGQIRGTPTASGTYPVTVSATNANGEGQPVVVTIVIQASLSVSGGTGG